MSGVEVCQDRVAWLTPRFLRGNHEIASSVFIMKFTQIMVTPRNDCGVSHATLIVAGIWLVAKNEISAEPPPHSLAFGVY